MRRLEHVWEVFRVSLYLGLTSFGGPIAHLGYFERMYVRQRRWLSAEQYGAIVALSQVLPGPTSSKVGFLIGLHRAGWYGALAAWTGFTLPSAVALFACAALITDIHAPLTDAAIHGLKLLAVAVVAQAVWSMAKRLCRSVATAGVALASAAVLLLGGPHLQVVAIALGALAGMCLRIDIQEPSRPGMSVISAGTGWIALALFVLLLAAFPLASLYWPHGYVALAGIFYRAGALVFGGGHVVLPLLHEALVPTGWVAEDQFLAGYGLAQAVPGPLFTFAAYAGGSASFAASAVLSALIGIIFIFLPGILLAIASVSLWHRLGDSSSLRAALAGVNAAVVGILAFALYDPIGSSALKTGTDILIASIGTFVLVRWNVSPIFVLLFCVGTALAVAL